MGEVSVASLHPWNDRGLEFLEGELGVRRLVALWILVISYSVTAATNISLT